MSRGFVKEDDQEEAPIIPQRAALPKGAINYVTQVGMDRLRAERTELEKERAELATTDEGQRRRDLAIIDGNLNLLQERIVSARILKLADQPKNEIRFGATIKYKILPAETVNTFQIVGVDEADLQKMKIAFVAPIAVALTGHKVGDVVDFKLGDEIKKLEILDITY